jgi:hypothetical protein
MRHENQFTRRNRRKKFFLQARPFRTTKTLIAWFIDPRRYVNNGPETLQLFISTSSDQSPQRMWCNQRFGVNKSQNETLLRLHLFLASFTYQLKCSALGSWRYCPRLQQRNNSLLSWPQDCSQPRRNSSWAVKSNLKASLSITFLDIPLPIWRYPGRSRETFPRFAASILFVTRPGENIDFPDGSKTTLVA